LYRRALIGVYARLAATSRALDHHVPERAADARSSPYDHASQVVADLQTIAASLSTHGSKRIAQGRVHDLIRAAQVFGFHLAPLDMRQHSRVHETGCAELVVRGAH